MSGGGGSTWTDVTITDANFTAVNDRRYYLPAHTLSANRLVNIGSITTQVMFIIEENYDDWHLSFTGGTVYDSGGSNVITEILGQWTTVYTKIGSKLIRTQ
jgi:hypothetical protein